jgi:beta-N-acetylhexosaminidase
MHRGVRAAVALVLAGFVMSAAKPVIRPALPLLTPEQRAAQALLRTMTLRDRVAQLILATADAEPVSSTSRAFEHYVHWVRDLHVGGLIIGTSLRDGQTRIAQPYATAVLLNRLQKMSRVPLLVGSDFERGASFRVDYTARFPYNMAYGAADDVEASRFEGLAAAREARALGIHWIFAPDADVNSNPENPIINIRSYGEDPDAVSRHVAAFVDGAHSDPKNLVLVTAKHFPGHGDTDTDSHLDMPRLNQDREHMDAIELKPFETAIAHGVDAIMTAHMSVPAIEPDDIPATVSPKVLTGLLRGELKFKNLIITDAMDMQGLTKEFNGAEASVRAIMAGADVLLMPPDPEQAIQAVVTAVLRGRIPRQRVDESALRVLTAKVRLGLTRNKLVNVEMVGDVLGAKESAESAQRVSDHAITLVKNEGQIVPLKNANQACVIVAVQSRSSTSGARFAQEFARRAKEARIVTVDSTMPEAALEAMVGDAGSCSEIVVSANVAVAAYQGDVALGGDLAPFLERLTDGPVPVVMVAVGNPYLLASFPKVAAYMGTFSVTPPSEFSAVKALFGQMAITGRMPVSIPGFAALGDGIQLPARTN